MRLFWAMVGMVAGVALALLLAAAWVEMLHGDPIEAACMFYGLAVLLIVVGGIVGAKFGGRRLYHSIKRR